MGRCWMLPRGKCISLDTVTTRLTASCESYSHDQYCIMLGLRAFQAALQKAQHITA